LTNKSIKVSSQATKQAQVSLINNDKNLKKIPKNFKCRKGVKTVKKVKGRGGRPDRVDLIVNIDLVSRKLAQAACVRCHGTKCPLLTAFCFFLSSISLRLLLFSQKELS
jgi:hypothetical protein